MGLSDDAGGVSTSMKFGGLVWEAADKLLLSLWWVVDKDEAEDEAEDDVEEDEVEVVVDDTDDVEVEEDVRTTDSCDEDGSETCWVWEERDATSKSRGDSERSLCWGNSSLESSESLYNTGWDGFGGLRAHKTFAGVSTVSCGLNLWRRCAKVGCGCGLEGKMCFPIRECRRRPLGDTNVTMQPG